MSKKKGPAWKTDPNSFWHPNTHTGVLIICSVVIFAAAAIFAFCFSIARDYITAPYKTEVEATLVNITKGTQKRWEYTESKEEARNPNLRTTRTYTETVYTYHWKYDINDKSHIWKTTENSGTLFTVGDTQTMRFWSTDGVEYHRSWSGVVNYVFMFLSAAVILAALYVIVRVLIIKIILKKEDHQRVKEAKKPAPDLRSYDGKCVRITDRDGIGFEGICDYSNEEFCEHAYGRNEPGLKIANFIFYRDDIKKIESLENHRGPYGCFSAPYGKIEELNFQEGMDCIWEELYCEEDVHVLRMLNCIDALEPSPSEELKEVLRDLLKHNLSQECRDKINALLQRLPAPL